MPRALLAALAAAATLAVVVPTAPRGSFANWDAEVKYDVARNFAEGRGLSLDQAVTPNDRSFVRYGQGGRRFSYFPFLACLASLPTYGLARWGGVLLPGLPGILALAATAPLLVLWGRRLGVPPLAALAGALATVLATPLWPSAVHEYDSGFEVLALVALLWAHAGSGRTRDWLVTGALLGVAYGVRQTSALLAVPGLLLVATQAPRGIAPVARRLAAIAAGMAPALAGTMAYDLYRFGVPLWFADVSSAAVPFLSADYLRGVAGLLVSPGKGIVWYSPLLLPALLRLRSLLGRWGLAIAAPLAYLAAASLLYPLLANWSGDWCWGPRYILAANVAVTPVAWSALEWAAPAVSRRRRLGVALVGLAAAAWQCVAITPPPVANYFGNVVLPLARAGALHGSWSAVPIPADWGLFYFSWGNSPLVVQARGFVAGFAPGGPGASVPGMLVAGLLLLVVVPLLAVVARLEGGPDDSPR